MRSPCDPERAGVRVSRRQFLGAVAVPVVLSACSRRPYDASRFVLPPMSSVALLPAASYAADVADLIGRGLRELQVSVRGRRVLLKPNLIEYNADRPIHTDPRVVGGAAAAFLRAGAAEVVVGEGPGHRRDTEYLIAATGLLSHLREQRIRFVDLNQDDVARVPLGSRYTGLTELALPREVLRSDFIVSLPKLKTHHWAGMTASMKNLFGVLPGAVYGWPKNLLHVRGIFNSILDLNATVRPHLAIVDAITAMEGDGPIMGRAKPVGMLAMGRDLVAVDATCARVMGLDPFKLPYLREGARFLGHADAERIEQRGEPLARYATQFDLLERLEVLRPDPE